MNKGGFYKSGFNFSLLLMTIIGLILLFPVIFTIEEQQTTNTPEPEITSIRYYFDIKNNLSIDDLLIDDSLLSKESSNPTSFSHNVNTIWLKIIVHNPLDQHYSWVLDTQNKHIINAHVYERVLQEGEPGYQLIYSHADPHIQNLPYSIATISSKVSFAAKETKILYIRYHSLMSTHLHIDFKTVENATNQHYYQNFVLGVTVTILTVLAFINLLFYFSLGKPFYLYYCLHELMAICLLVAASGNIALMITPDNAGTLAKSEAFISLILMVFSTFFVDAFLDVKSVFPKIKPVKYTYITLCFILLLLGLLPATQAEILQYVIPPFVFSFVAFVLGLSVYLIYRRKYYVIPFCIGWTVLVSSIAIVQISLIDLYPIEFVNHQYTLYFGFVVEGVLMAVSIGLQTAKLRKEHHNRMGQLITIYQERAVEAGELQLAFNEKVDAIAEKINKSKQLASASHDIHHNLYLIKLNIESLKNENNQKQIQGIQSSLMYLENITTNVLAESRYEVGNNPGKFSVNQLFESLCTELSPLAINQNIVLRYHETDVSINGSKIILKRILENLLRNAIQHTRHGGVLLVLRRSTSHYKIQVFDTGCGMADDVQKNITEAYIQGAATEAGYGLGLYIVSTLCNQAGYSLRLRSTPGKGSTFSISIPK